MDSAVEKARRIAEIERRWEENEITGSGRYLAMQPHLGSDAALALARALLSSHSQLERMREAIHRLDAHLDIFGGDIETDDSGVRYFAQQIGIDDPSSLIEACREVRAALTKEEK